MLEVIATNVAKNTNVSMMDDMATTCQCRGADMAINVDMALACLCGEVTLTC